MSTLLELLQKRKQQTSRIKTLKPAVGRGRYRILPGWRITGEELKAWIKAPAGTEVAIADPTFFMDFGQHFIKDAMGQIVAVTICQEKTFGKPCDVCSAISHGILNSVDDLTKKRLTDAKASSRVLLNVLHIDGPTPEEPQILEVAPSVFNGAKGVGGIISLFDEWPDLLHPLRGNDIIIEKSGTGMETRYGVQVAGSSKPVPIPALGKIANLDKFVAAEQEEAFRKALTSVSSITGLLPAPSAGGGTEHLFDDVLPDMEPVRATPATAPEAVKAPEVVAEKGGLDDELDALLADLPS
jgi:hypothetical protein